MSILLRLLGLIAFVSDRLSRVSLRALTANWVVIALLLVGFGAATNSWEDARRKGAHPRVMSVQAFTQLAATRFGRPYVVVNGLVIPRARVQVASSTAFTPSSPQPAYDLVAFLDNNALAGMWIKVAPDQYAGQKPFPARVEGIMSDMPSATSVYLLANRPVVGRVTPTRRAWLETGRTPPAAWWPALA